MREDEKINAEAGLNELESGMGGLAKKACAMGFRLQIVILGAENGRIFFAGGNPDAVIEALYGTLADVLAENRGRVQAELREIAKENTEQGELAREALRIRDVFEKMKESREKIGDPKLN